VDITIQNTKTADKNGTVVTNVINRFMAGRFYPIIVGAVCLLCHSLGLELIFFTLVAVAAVYICFCNGNSLRMIPLVLMSLIAMSHVNNEYMHGRGLTDFIADNNAGLIYLILLMAVFGMAITYFLARKVAKKPSRLWEAYAQYADKPFEQKGLAVLRKSKLLFGLLIFGATYLLAGAFFSGYETSSLGYSMGLFAVLVPVFVLILLTVEWDKKSFDYVCDCMTVMLAVVALQIGLLYITDPDLANLVYTEPRAAKSLIFLGWAASNLIANMIAVILPFVLYRMVTSKQPLVYFAVAGAAVIGMVYTFSRTGALFVLPMYALVSIFALFKAKGRKWLWITYGISAVIALIVLSAFWTDITRSLNFFFSQGGNDSERFVRWEYGIGHFIDWPVFGVGFSYLTNVLGQQDGRLRFALYHNYIVQLIASMGMIGLLAYLFHRYQTIKILIKKFDRVNVFIFISIGMFVTTSLVNNTLFSPLTMVIYSIAMVMLECHNRKEQI